jgi:hypothetical protein
VSESYWCPPSTIFGVRCKLDDRKALDEVSKASKRCGFRAEDQFEDSVVRFNRR